MQRRDFMTQSIAASAFALSKEAPASVGGGFPPARGYFELRRYQLITGPQMASLTDAYLSGALIPALNRQNIGPVGAFHLDYGVETPAIYLLLPSATLEPLVSANELLARDSAFLKSAAAFNSVSTDRPAFHRVDSSLLRAFEGFPFPPPPAQTPAAKRIFQLRTYESPTPRAHERKIEMFHSGEFEIFKKTGLEAVFFGETVIGPRLPSLTYLLTFKDLATLEANWKVFSADPEWAKLKTSARFTEETLVSNITNLVLSPLPYSQI